MHISKRRVQIHPERVINIPSWLEAVPQATSSAIWRIFLVRYFHVHRSKSDTALSSQVRAICGIDKGLNAENRVMGSTTQSELEDGAVIRLLEASREESLTLAMMQAKIMSEIWSSLFISNYCTDASLCTVLVDWSDLTQERREFTDWVIRLPTLLTTDFQFLVTQSTKNEKSISESIKMLANDEGLTDINIFKTTKIKARGNCFDYAEFHQAIWDAFVIKRKDFANAFGKSGQDALRQYTLNMSKKKLLYTEMFSDRDNVAARARLSTLPPRADNVANFKRQKKIGLK